MESHESIERNRALTSMHAIFAVATLALAGCHNHVFFQDTGARPVRLSDFQEPATRVSLVRGKGYELAPTNRKRTSLLGDDRQYLLVDVGYLNPIVAFSNRTFDSMTSPDQPYITKINSDGAGSVPPPPDRTDGRWTTQFSVPVAFHLFWDPFTANNPILDTDYTFGADLSVRGAIAEGLELRVGSSYNHISTHVGDEYVIANTNTTQGPFPFDRVNVSYWPIRAWSSLRYYAGCAPHFTWIVEVTGEVERIRSGHYELFPFEADPARVPLSPATTEGAVTIDVRQAKGIALKPTSQQLSGYVRGSVTIANRTVFPYHNGLTSAQKALQTNVVVGYVLPYRLRLGARQIMLYSRYFAGPNPYGQFRNQKATWFAGLGAAVIP